MIPKIIHYCWFGGNPKPELALKCINSWKKYCPDYEIKEWNESNYDVTKTIYTKEAYEKKKYAFVSDYARFDILYQEGGYYFDTDVELLTTISDIGENRGFFGLEIDDYNLQEIKYNIAPGLGMASEPRNCIYKRILDEYRERHFILSNGKLNTVTVCNYVTDLFYTLGFDGKRNERSSIEGIDIYPTDYFCPMVYSTGELKITENTKSIHWYSASWKTEKERYNTERRRKFIRKYGAEKGNRRANVCEIPYKIKKKIKEEGIKGMVVFSIKKIKGLTK